MKPQTKTSEEPLAWEEMVVVEPRLARLLSDIQAIKDPGGPKGFCANYHWVTNLKPTFVRLVGFQARGEDARLREALRAGHRLQNNTSGLTPAGAASGRCAPG
jgi:hypothetical protein